MYTRLIEMLSSFLEPFQGSAPYRPHPPQPPQVWSILLPFPERSNLGILVPTGSPSPISLHYLICHTVQPHKLSYPYIFLLLFAPRTQYQHPTLSTDLSQVITRLVVVCHTVRHDLYPFQRKPVSRFIVDTSAQRLPATSTSRMVWKYS